ncbi:MAG: thiamine-phosphate kinase [Acidobacteriota bacterium]
MPADLTIAALGEHALLARLRARVTEPPADVLVSIGDDAAVVASARNAFTVLTTDALVEGVHFRRAWSTPADVGHKALAVNLSDLAAMGARPRWALLSLMLPGELPAADVDGLIDGLTALGRRHGVALVGGNLTRTPGPLVVDVTAVGEVRPRRVLRRRGAVPGDELYVSGTLGAGRAGLEALAAGTPDAARGCVARYLRPEARVALGRAIADARAARAAMDLSDGLADAVRQVAEASGCGAVIDGAALPVDPEARRWFEARGVDAVTAAMTGGDDYELLVAVPPRWKGRLRHARRHVADPPLTRIGVLTKDRGTVVVERGGRMEALPAGYEHFTC